LAEMTKKIVCRTVKFPMCSPVSMCATWMQEASDALLAAAPLGSSVVWQSQFGS